MFNRLFKRNSAPDVAGELYLKVVAQSRREEFYIQAGVPDTIEGRYDMIILHAWMLLRRIGTCPEKFQENSRVLSQAFFDLMFADMDRNLREMGVTDTGVGKRVRRMAEAFYGRINAYDTGLIDGDPALSDALSRNLYQSGQVPGAEVLARMVGYIRRQVAHLAGLADEAVLKGEISFENGEGL